MLTIALLLQVAAPSAEAERLGATLATQGAIVALLPAITGKEVEDQIGAHREWSAADQSAFRRVAAATLARQTAVLTAATGHQYAQFLSVDELRALVAFNVTPAAARYRAVQPQVIGGTMASIGKIDFMGDTMKAFCAETGKGCPKP